MIHFVLRLLDLVRFRAGPQDLPAGWPVALTMTAAYLLQGLLADRLVQSAGDAAADGGGVPRSLVAIAIQVLATALLLKARGLSERLPQTITALAGVGLVFGLISTLLVVQARPGQPQAGLVLLWLGLFLWSLTVDGHIYRHALGVALRTGVLIAVLIFALNFMVMVVLFPA